MATREELLGYTGLARIVVDGPAGAQVLYNPTPNQDAFHLAPEPNVLFGGAAGGGKSHAVRHDAYMRCLSVAGYRALLLRRTYPELADTHIERAILEQKDLGFVLAKTEFKARFQNGSVLQFGHCEDDASVVKYLSAEYDAIYFDEASTFTEHQYKFIASRARSTKPGVRAVVRCASNPGGVGAIWLKRYFVDRDITPEEDPAYQPENYRFIRSLLSDNPYLGDDYRARLLALPSEALRRAYLYGDWDVFEGQEFSEWRAIRNDREWHVISDLPTVEGKPIDEIPWIEHYRAIDWGYSTKGVCLWISALPDGRLIVTDEWVFSRVIASEVAREIKTRTGKRKVRLTIADPSMWMKEGAIGESIAETFQRNGVPLVKADNERKNGWQRLHEWLSTEIGEPPRPMLQVLGPRCPYLVKTIPVQTSDPVKPGDILSKNVEDHAVDALRYGVMARPAPSRQRVDKRPRRGTLGYDIQKLMRREQDRHRLGAEAVRR